MNPPRATKLAARLGVVVSLLTAVGCTDPAMGGTGDAVYVRAVSEGIHETSPVRGEPGPLRLHRDGDEYECSACHDGFSGMRQDEALQDEHSDITFDHGRNVLCLNCHHKKNSDAFADFGDAEIPGDQPTLLCAKCHGPHYREWRLGVHGRVSGYWDKQYGPQQWLDCIQCHAPHRPKFQPMSPVPPPVLTRFDIPKSGLSHD